MVRFFVSGVLASIALTSLAWAQAPQDPGQKSSRMVRTATPPVIDGNLDDAVWQQAAFIDDLHQVNPTEYAEPSERTEIYVLYDDNALYIGARMYMSDLDEITANVLRQNGAMTADDNLFVTLDPFNSRRSGYFFGINANGVRMDGLYRNVSEYYSDWDTIFYAQTGRFEQGWTVEYEIPFKSISFDPNTDTWGLNFSRSIATRNEDIAWVTRNRRWDPSSAGLAVGFDGIQQGVGLDVITSASLNRQRVFGNRDQVAAVANGFDSSSTSDFEPSLDAVYKITPALNGSVTINTDFSATEVDDRQVNLTRFNLFFPEKRGFFLSEADIFEFGRIGAQDGNGSISGATRQNGRPFFSRRIGLGAGGEVLDLQYGGKVSGRVGNWEIGALSIRQDENGPVGADNLSVVRAKAAVGDESNVGIILTEGDPRTDLENSLVGLDYLYRNSDFAGGQTLEAVAWYQQTDTPGLEGEDAAYGLGVSIPSAAGLRGGVSLKEYQKNFNPALGFITLSDVRSYAGHVAYTYRPAGGYWQQLYFNVDVERMENIGGGLQSQSVGITPLQMTSRSGDVLFIRINANKDVLYVPFEISPGIVIPTGSYSFADSGVEWRFASYRKFSGRVAYTEGDFYTGTRDRLFGNVTWQPSPKFRANVGYNFNDIKLAQGDFRTRLITTGFDIVFSSTLSWVNLIQYDNVSETMGVNMRLHWIPEAGKEMFFVINQTLEDLDLDDKFHSQFSDVTLKASYTFRF